MQLHAAYGSQQFSDRACFLCGDEANITNEHVFPKWLQEKFNLWDQRITLLNGSRIQYRNLTIPCCRRCNNEYLSELEGEISRLVKLGYEAAVKTEGRVWYLWMAKLFYGLLRKELNLCFDQANPASGSIATEELLKSQSNLHLFLQGVRGKHEFVDKPPYSILICNLHNYSDEESFSFRDNLFQLTASIRLGGFGAIASFEDGGLAHATYGRYVAEVNGRKLHPLQFDELYAKVAYQASLIEGAPKFLTETRIDGKDVARTTTFFSTSVKPWNQGEFVKALRSHLFAWFENPEQSVEFVAPDLVSTWMVDSSGNLLLLEKEQWQQSLPPKTNA